MRNQVEHFCKKIGQDPLFVQGAGGNVSWKEGELLWVKASGTWLANAMSQDIFVPVSMNEILSEVKKNNFLFTPVSSNLNSLKPSIETILHALMPQKFIVHVHAVEILSILIRENSKEEIKRILGNDFNYIYLEYVKPGPDLAKAMHREIFKNPNAQIVFLANHGVVIGANSIQEIDDLLNEVSELMTSPKNNLMLKKLKNKKENYDSLMSAKKYRSVGDNAYNALALIPELSNRLTSDWALCPDHVVFLGHEAKILNKNIFLDEIGDSQENSPVFIFSLDQGVYESLDVNIGQKAQLECYFEIIKRQDAKQKLSSLSPRQVSDLLNWDAEKYRQSLKL